MKLNINSARKGNSSYNFSPLSLVSLDFGRLQPVRSFSVIPGSNFSRVKGTGLLRCTPQVFPPFGRMNVKSASFFVPDSQLFSWSSSFHANNKQWRGQKADLLPSIRSEFLNYAFGTNIFPGLSTLVSSNPSVTPALNTYDFVYPSGNGLRGPGNTNLDFYRITPYGWKIYAIFKSLGYDFVTFPIDLNNSHVTQESHVAANTSFISLVPFLAYAKIWNDYFCNSYTSDNTDVASYLQRVYLNKDIVVSGVTYYNSSTVIAIPAFVFSILSLLQVPFESNMYTTAWNNPNDPTGTEISRLNQVNQQSLISPFGSSAGEFNTLAADVQRNTHSSSVASSLVNFSQLGHRTLESFDKFVRRHNLVGSKAVQQIYALFGIQPSEWNKDYVIKLCESSNRVNFSSITSQSDTVNGASGKPLGAFAGIGLCGYDLDFSYKADTFGTIICLSWLNIDPILMHGFSSDVLRVKPVDFYIPDYDGKAYRPIPYCEVTGAKSLPASGFNATSIFGYTNMYDDYRNMRDVVAGTFLDDTTKHFAFMRDLTDTRRILNNAGVDMYPQSQNVQYWYLDGNSDLTNPFITSPSAGDRFWFCIDWDIKCTLPILSNEDSFDLDGQGSLSINKNGDGIA